MTESETALQQIVSDEQAAGIISDLTEVKATADFDDPAIDGWQLAIKLDDESEIDAVIEELRDV